MTVSNSYRAKQAKISLVILAVLAVLYFFFGKNNTNTSIDRREKAFRHNEIKLTKHAQCRMDCRQIDESEVKDILAKGAINYNKSDLKDKPCPTYALEGITKDNQRVRVVVGDCNNEAVIITVIDLDHEFECTCD
ncbi:MAG: DUF4258 domain-containing protein [Bacteroidetes bacterium]|nr:DUF4258 domain-containing protein [Bacteroidota bacterium]MBP6403535.1 DUF4258 domain-containing protein [Bacteroidia bacterium]MBK6840367.1 DUF4258 domain-containing protein [Bacteroidota bacterium]MBK9524087.1 DUF4258 domain-containing protein [Bacteroidota bacterium]MBK9541828.1 DUF4258 domain-containing protein [Bacteroidota bacterium]